MKLTTHATVMHINNKPIFQLQSSKLENKVMKCSYGSSQHTVLIGNKIEKFFSIIVQPKLPLGQYETKSVQWLHVMRIRNGRGRILLKLPPFAMSITIPRLKSPSQSAAFDGFSILESTMSLSSLCMVNVKINRFPWINCH